MHVRTYGHLEEELEHHSVHVGARQHRHHLRIGRHLRLGRLVSELDIGIEGPVRDHHALGESGSTGSIVDDGQFVGLILVIGDVIGGESVGIHGRKGLREVVAYVLKVLSTRIQVFESVHLHDDVQSGHLSLGEALPKHLVHEEDLRFGVVDQIVDIAGLELVQDGHGDRAIGKGGEETYSPVGLVARADGDFVALLEAAFLESYMQVLDTLGHGLVSQGDTVVVGERRTLPILLEAFLKELVY